MLHPGMIHTALGITFLAVIIFFMFYNRGCKKVVGRAVTRGRLMAAIEMSNDNISFFERRIAALENDKILIDEEIEEMRTARAACEETVKEAQGCLDRVNALDRADEQAGRLP